MELPQEEARIQLWVVCNKIKLIQLAEKNCIWAEKIMWRTCAFETQQRATMTRQDNGQEKKNHKWQQLKDGFKFDTCRMGAVIMFCSYC